MPRYVYPVTLSSSVNSAPVYLTNVVTPSGTKNLLFLLSKNGIMAIDAARQRDLVAPDHRQTAHDRLAGDRSESSVRLQLRYRRQRAQVPVGDGTEITSGGWPELITLKTDFEKGASGLTIASADGTTYLVVVTDGYIGDGGDYQGHVTSINLSTGAQTCSTRCAATSPPSSPAEPAHPTQSGIWGRGGAMYDAATGRVYIATGNGHFNANTGGHNWGDSVLALAPDGAAPAADCRATATRRRTSSSWTTDTDLGLVSPAILPAPAGSTVAHLGMQTGKDANLRLINLDNMSGAGAPAHVGGEMQLLNVPQGGGGMREQPAMWVNGRPLDLALRRQWQRLLGPDARPRPGGLPALLRSGRSFDRLPRSSRTASSTASAIAPAAPASSAAIPQPAT